MATGSAVWARGTDAGVAGITLRRCNDAHDVETEPGGTDSALTLH